jgi:hypothetical protein
MVGVPADIQVPAHDVAGLGFLRVKALLRVARVMVAVERFRLAHDRWPDAIDVLIPTYLGAAPIDPYTGRELILRKLPDGVAIYSLGSELADDGGQFEPRGTDNLGFDLGYRLWTPEVRGRPPDGQLCRSQVLVEISPTL